MGETLLQLEGITKLFPGVKALDDVQLNIQKGELHALIGENGAGKSTLMKILLGIYQRDSGTITYKGKQVNFSGPFEVLKAGISMIHQEISLVQTMDIAENIWLGREKEFAKLGILSVKRRYKATKELLENLGMGFLNPHSVVKTLSVANMQLVEIARAVSYNSDLIIMDEPTSSLTSVEIDLLYKLMRSLAEKGVAVIFISHKLEEIFEVCDRVTVLRDGRYITTKKCTELNQDDLIKYIVGRELNEMFPKLPAEIHEPVLEVKNFSSAGVFEDVNFNVRAGEILGFSGLVGAGRTEIMRAIFGIDKYTSGTVMLNGKEIHITDPKDAIRHGLGMVTEDRFHTGSIYSLSVMANMTISHFKKICNKLGLFTPTNELKAFNSIADKVSIKYSSPKELMSKLSGGNQQKVIISRWLLTNPKVLILDEPTRGIDVGSKAEIHRLISTLAQQGMAIIMISSELPEILGMCDRIEIVKDGRIVHECMREDATQEVLIQYAFGTQL